MIIDFHAHIFPDKIASATISALSKNAGIKAHSTGDYAGLVSQMEKSGIDIAVNLPVVTKASQFDSITDFSYQINQKSTTTHRIISFAGIHPDSVDYESELEKIKSLGFLGIKIHPDYQGTFFDDKKYIKILSYAKKLDLITVTHAGVDGAFIGQEIKCTPYRVLRLLDALGGYEKLVLAHMGGNELFDDVANNLAGENVYFDTAYVLPYYSKEMFETILEKHGADKILFATDSPWQDLSCHVNRLLSYGLDEKTQNKIFYENAKGLLNL